jgi:selenocysteine-specific elongation factor
MVAGATGIDLYLMTIAADDGVMPQTREHAAVLRALGVDAGVVAITKSDLADPATAIAEAAELMPGAEAVAVSARTGAGLDELCVTLDGVAQRLPSRAALPGAARLHIDRVFTIRGAGTVVTGTLWSGTVGRSDELQLLPSGRRFRVRGVQVHDQSVERASAGQRVAVNLTNASVSDVDRGDVLAAPGHEFSPTFLIDAELEFSDAARREPEHGDRVQVHHGTRESAARMAWLGGPYWQIRLEQQLIPARDDRLVIRQIAPPDTIGGGRVLDPRPRKHGPSRALTVRLQRLARGEQDAEPVEGAQHRIPAAPEPITSTEALSPSALALEARLREAGFEPPLDSELDPDDLAALRAAGSAVRVSRTLHYHADVLGEIRERVISVAGRHGGSVTLGQLRDELGTSRKFAQALLEHFDSERLTIRRGDAHVLRGARSGHLERG